MTAVREKRKFAERTSGTFKLKKGLKPDGIRTPIDDYSTGIPGGR